MRTFLALVSCLSATACIDPSDGGDVESIDSVDQAVSIWDDCASGPASNALVYEPPDSYTRSASTINQTCGCRDWQADKNLNGQAHADAAFPDCRPMTYVDFGLHVQQYGYRLGAEVPSWNLTNGQTECENSTLTVKVVYWTGSQYNLYTQSPDLHPIWSNGKCQPLSWFSGQVSTSFGPLQARAKATRGLDEFNHGYEGVKISAVVF